VVNLRAVYRVVPHVSLTLRLQNLFNRNYSDFGVIGNASTVLPQFTDPRLISPGAPRAEWVGVSIDF
jgi:iron complex outermembrane recepter protein